MTTDRTILFSEIREAVAELTFLTEGLEPDRFNEVPYEGSWTPGQLVRHVTKSLGGLSQSMSAPGEPADRDPGANIAKLKEVFLDFSHKMKSPEFILPEERWYEKQASTDELIAAEEQLVKNAATANLSELVKGLPMGPVTKLEILHFVLYHTLRHVHQMKKMQGVVAI